MQCVVAQWNTTVIIVLFCALLVTAEGKVYACGEGTNGRLGLGSSQNVDLPRQIPALSPYVIKKIAVHSGKNTYEK